MSFLVTCNPRNCQLGRDIFTHNTAHAALITVALSDRHSQLRLHVASTGIEVADKLALTYKDRNDTLEYSLTSPNGNTILLHGQPAERPL